MQSNWELKQFERAIHGGGVGLWSWHPASQDVVLDKLSMDFWQVAQPAQTLETLFAKIHDEDREAAIEQWLASADSDGTYKFDFRIATNHETRWISARGEGTGSNLEDGTVMAVFVDVTSERAAEEAQRLVAREMLHRIGNLFAVAASVTSMTARSATSVPELATDLRTRFQQLRGGFAYAGTKDAGLNASVPLGPMLHRLVSAYPNNIEQVRISGAADLEMSSELLPNMALVVHELATNSLKYGALSVEAGCVELSIAPNPADASAADASAYVMTWAEHGGPEVREVPKQTSFGTKLLDQIAKSAFGGDIARSAPHHGLVVELTISDGFLNRAAATASASA